MSEIKESKRIMRFVTVGTLNAMITATVIFLMMEKLDCNYMASNIVAYVVAQMNNFFWSKYWVFTARDGRFRREIPLFLIAFGCAYVAQFLVLLVLVEVIDLNEYLAQFLGLFVYGTVNFLLNKRVTFLK